MSIVGVVIEGQPTKWEQVPASVLPPEMVAALKGQDRTNEVHVSDLTICPYRIVRDKFSDVYVPLSTATKLLRGNGIDALVNTFPRPNTIYQQRYSRVLQGIELIGTPDLIDLDHKTIEDYKAPSSRMRQVPDNYATQLNAYRWLTNGVLPVKIKGLFLNVIAPKEVQVLRVPMWNLYETETLLSAKLFELLEVMELGKTGSVGTCGDYKCIYCKTASMLRLGEVVEDEVVEDASE